MGMEEKQSLQHLQSQEVEGAKIQHQINSWLMKKGGDGDGEGGSSAFISFGYSEDSTSSSSTVFDLLEDASSSSPISSPSASACASPDGPLYELSELMAQLPVKRGLSKYYAGKSQSFTALASVKSLEDLAKKENPYNMRMKLCRSYAEGLDGHHHHHQQQHSQRFCTPKHTIAKKISSRGSFSSTMLWSNDLLSTCDRPPIPIEK